ncbi:MAG: hypothetical protein ACE148_03355 [Vicinamibacterales bacterium]
MTSHKNQSERWRQPLHRTAGARRTGPDKPASDVASLAPRRFVNEGDLWEVGQPAQAEPAAARYRVRMTRLFDGLTLTGWISTDDVQQAELSELRRAVNQAMARASRDDEG